MVTLSKSRIELLSDGVVAIAMTLLALDLKVPEVMSHHSDREVLVALLELKGEFLTYVVTFLIASAFWYLHHLTFHFIKHVNGFLVWVNLIFLMFVALLPFSSGLMSDLFVHPISQFFYFGNMLAIALLLNLHWQYARWKHLIVETEQTEADILSFRVALTAAAFGASFLTAFFFPAYSWAPVPAFLLVGWILERSR
jgi:uncharacterized membrane protein